MFIGHDDLFGTNQAPAIFNKGYFADGLMLIE
jgi:hypothetical protein